MPLLTGEAPSFADHVGLTLYGVTVTSVAKAAPTTAEDDGDALSCFACGEPFRADDICATDITEGTAHAACLEGAAIVDLETGEPSEGPIETWRYGDRA